jgi:hypothetical protein
MPQSFATPSVGHDAAGVEYNRHADRVALDLIALELSDAPAGDPT